MSDDADDKHEVVRSAIEQHGGFAAEPENSLEGENEEQQATRDVSDQVEAQLNEGDRNRDQSKRRDVKGRFTSSKGEADPRRAPHATNDTPKPEDWSAHRKPELPRYTNGWPDAAKAEFEKLSPAVKAAIEKREFETDEGFKQYADKLVRLKQIEDVIAPQWADFEKAGYQNPGHVFAQLLDANNRLVRDPQAAVQLAQTLPPQHQAALRQAFGGSGYSQQQLDAYVQQRMDELVKEVRPYVEQQKKEAAEAAVAQYKKQTARMEQKVKASNASMNGAPHGVASPAPRAKAVTKFDDYSNSVREAINSLL